MSSLSEPTPDRDDRIQVYLTGEMPDGERAAFERELRGDLELNDAVQAAREALDAARDWLRADPPGLERVDRLPVPPLRRPARIVTLRRPFWQAAAAAALFLGGFLLGRGSGEAPAAPASTATQTVVESPMQPASPAESPAVPRRAVRSVQDENGRLVIETTLADNGVHATWVVDGNFQIAQASGR